MMHRYVTATPLKYTCPTIAPSQWYRSAETSLPSQPASPLSFPLSRPSPGDLRQQPTLAPAPATPQHRLLLGHLLLEFLLKVLVLQPKRNLVN